MPYPNSPPPENAGFPTVGCWLITSLPAGWIFMADYGIKELAREGDAVLSNIGLGEDALAPAQDLKSYIKVQVGLIQKHLESPVIAGPGPVQVEGAEEAYLLFIRHKPINSGTMLHVQTYAQFGRRVGLITLTTPESQLTVVRPSYDAFVKGLRYKHNQAV